VREEIAARVRWLGVVGLLVGTACASAPAPAVSAGPSEAPVPAHARGATARPSPLLGPDDGDAPSVDPIVELARDAGSAAFGWVAPRQLALAHGDAPIFPATDAPRYVQILEHHGDDVRIGVRLPTARFALWTDATGLFGVIRREVSVASQSGGGGGFGDSADVGPVEVVLRAGARVEVIAREATRAHVRYLGDVEVEGWVPSDAIGDRVRGAERGAWPRGFFHPLTVLPGAAIRVAPEWSARALAVTTERVHFVEEERDLGDGKHVVSYADADVRVRGIVDTRAPPARTHGHRADDPSAPPPPLTTTVASGTCLYARARGEAIGFIVGDAPVDLEPATGSWFTLALDSPWGALTFAAQGARPTELVACAPAGSVPPTHVTSSTGP
jgi:hypothetical protein